MNEAGVEGLKVLPPSLFGMKFQKLLGLVARILGARYVESKFTSQIALIDAEKVP